MSTRVSKRRKRPKKMCWTSGCSCCDEEDSSSLKRSSTDSQSDKNQEAEKPGESTSAEESPQTSLSLPKKTRKDSQRKPATCMICKRSFFNKKMLKDHNTKHHFLRHCPNCPASFLQTRKFILHLRSHLSMQYPYVCRICLACFPKKKVLLAHKEKGHTSLETYSCNTCSEVFMNIISRNSHQLIHEQSPYKCYRCEATFSNILDRTVHLENHLFHCRLCSVSFQNQNDLVNHLLSTEHDIQSKVPVNTVAVESEEDSDSDSMDDYCSSDNDSVPDIDSNYQKEAVEPVYNLKHKNKYICFICYALYPSPAQLKSHMKPHTWYPCNSCPKFFADLETFKNHIITCVPIYQCKNCGAEAECKNCGAKFNCKNCKKNIGNTADDNSDGSTSISPEQKIPSPEKSADNSGGSTSISSEQKIPSPEKSADNSEGSTCVTPEQEMLSEKPIYLYISYHEPSTRKVLYEFIEKIKSEKKPLDIFSLSLIGMHALHLNGILKDENIRRHYPEESIPCMEKLFSEFQDLLQNLCDQINHSS